MINKDDTIICDSCENFYIHPSGCTEKCSMVKNEPFNQFTSCYAEPRMLGNVRNCKEFKQIKPLTFGGMSINKRDIKTLIKG